MGHGGGKIGVPGGLVAAGGTFRDSAVRELREEAGVHLRESNLVKICAHARFGKCPFPACTHAATRVAYNFVSSTRPYVGGPEQAHVNEIDMSWNGSGLLSAGPGTGHFWATAEQLRSMHQRGPEIWFPRLREDLEMFLAFGGGVTPLHLP